MFKRNPERDHRAGYRDYNAVLRSERGPEKQAELLALRAIRRSRGALSPREAQQLLQYERDAAHAYDKLAYRKPGEMPGVVADRAKWRAREPQARYSRVDDYHFYGPRHGGLWPGESHPGVRPEHRWFRNAAQDVIFATRLRPKKGSKTQRKR